MAKLIVFWRLLGETGRAILAGALMLLSVIVGHKVSVRRAEKRGRKEGESSERARNEAAVSQHRKRAAEVVHEEREKVSAADRSDLLERLRREARDAGGDR